MTKQELNLGGIFSAEVAGLKQLINRHAVELSVCIPDDAVVYGDPQRLQPAIRGILSHVITAAPGGEVRISALRRDYTLEVVVEYSAVAARDRLAEILEETETTGLGVSVHEVLVAEHGGTVTLDGKPGSPSRLVLTLPTTAAAPFSIPIANLKPSEADLAPKRILIADNDEDVSGMVKAFLVDRGYEVELARNGKEALIKAKSIDPQMIILDVMMPDISGFDIIQVLKEDPATQHIPVMFLSILPDKEKGFRLGAVDYLVKPIREQSLMESVNAIFKKQRKGKRKKVLVVDDDRRVTMLMSNRLAAEGYITRQAYNGAEAIASMARDKPDLVLLDMNMPVMNGLETLERIQANDEWSDVPVIVVTATGYADKQRCISLGAAKYLTKPFVEEELLEEVAQITDKVTGGAQRNNGAGARP